MSELKIIDLSYHNGAVDFAKVKTQADGVILRCGYGSDIPKQDDKRFKEYVEACILYNIPFGVYLYSYAKSEEQAKSEAQHVLRLLEPYKDKLSYPVYYDLEEKGTESGAAERAIIFCDILEKEGYFVGVYASEYWWKAYLSDDSLNRFTKWVAKYGTNDGTAQKKPSVNGACDMWQYTSKGKINGISGNVDVNICYRDFPKEIKPTVTAAKPVQREYKYKVGDHVVFSTCYSSSTDDFAKHIKAEKMARNHGTITKIVNAKNPYLLDNGLCWVNDGDIRGFYGESSVTYYPRYTGDTVSIVDALKAIRVDSSLESRRNIAAKNGISNYSGTPAQNTKLLNLLVAGKLIK